MSITINGQTSPAAEFAWDGCHKIYLLDNGDADKNGKYGYTLSKNGEAGYKVLPVSELQRVWDQSCPLRFINNWALDKNMFPNATRSPSPSKRVERENHEIIQGIRGRIRSGYRSHPMGVQPLGTRYGQSDDGMAFPASATCQQPKRKEDDNRFRRNHPNVQTA